MGKHLRTTPIRCVIAILMAVFALIDLFGVAEEWVLDPRWMPAGGILSGFFGGLSGNQGAFRTMFLLKAGLTKEELIGTGAAIGCLSCSYPGFRPQGVNPNWDKELSTALEQLCRPVRRAPRASPPNAAPHKVKR